jgi:manganese/iron transport system ATP-binding protein
VPQAEDVDWAFPVSVWDVVLMGRYGYMNILAAGAARRISSIARGEPGARRDATKFKRAPDRRAVGRPERSGSSSHARWRSRRRVILLDEPFTGVDVTTEAAIIELLRELRDDGHIVLVSTHDLGSVPEFCDQCVIINRTVLAFGPTATTFTEANLTRAFGGALRNVRFDHTDTPGAHANEFHVLTDDEGALVFDHEGRPARASRRHGANGANARGRGHAMIEMLLTPFEYEYMVKAILVSGFIGGVCALSCRAL